jgi:hypothetical protein
MTLQLEPSAQALESGIKYLIEAFPDTDASFDLCGYSSSGVCIFLSVLRGSTALPAQRQVAGALQQLSDQILAGRTVFSMEPHPFDRAALRRLASVFAEVVVGGTSRGFPLLEGLHEQEDSVGVCVSQGFCDLALGRWDPWSAENAA